MKKKPFISASFILLCALAPLAYNCGGEDKSKDSLTSGQNTPFLNHRDSIPTIAQYNHPLFVLSHNYPTTFDSVINPSWQQALNGQPISSANALAYMDSLKSYVAPNVLPFFTDNANWTAEEHGWFNEPWLGSQREAILGAYLGNGNPANMFKSLKEDEAGYALVLYDSTAAYTVGQIWGTTGQLNLANNAAQFPEGSVIVKFAFSNVNAPSWPVLAGAQTFQIYDTIPTTESPATGYQMRKVSFFQMDIIVKDSKTAPKTGWVYSTFVYDKDAVGGLWEKMVPLGAMWGDDPNVNSSVTPTAPLYETVINPNAPAYSTETLGWGGRLSGPNDGAVVQSAVDIKTGATYTNLAVSSCMSCHAPAQNAFKSFLLPGPFPDSTFYVYNPGGPEWMLWFRDDYGTVPFDSGAGQVGMDYDMVMAFKSVSAYEAAQPSTKRKVLKNNFEAIRKFRLNSSRSKFWH